MNNVLLLLIISLIGPMVGAIIGIINYPSKRFIYNMLAFAAGIMLSISFLNLIPQSIAFSSAMIAVIGVMIGAGMMFLIDKMVPHLHPEMDALDVETKEFCNIKKSSNYITVGLFIHNIPEGMVIALGTIVDLSTGIIIAIAIAVQKIPEGICTAAPNYYCNNSRTKSFLISCASLIPLLAGFGLGYILYGMISNTLIGLIIGMTAGFMIYISADELIPTSSRKNTTHYTIVSFIVGVLFVIILNGLATP